MSENLDGETTKEMLEATARNYELSNRTFGLSILPQPVRRLLGKVASASFSGACLLCGGDSTGILCAGCRTDLPLLTGPRCPQCAEPTAGGEHCGRCLAHPLHFDATYALYRYEFPADQLVHALKYRGQLALAKHFGERLGDALAGRRFHRIIPLPLHPERLRSRGFNQSVEIAKALCHSTGLALDWKTCRRWRPTSPQAELPLQERSANIRGAFECMSDLSGQQILLVDDVMTSGATLDECARILKLHGAARVEAAVVARALRD